MSDDQVKIKKESHNDNAVCCSDGDYYPYGTGLSFEDDMIDSLNVGSLAVGDVVAVRGFAFVDSTSENASKEGSSKSLRLQMTSVALHRETDDRVKQLYGDES